MNVQCGLEMTLKTRHLFGFLLRMTCVYNKYIYIRCPIPIVQDLV
jgi:hypothetical protein